MRLKIVLKLIFVLFCPIKLKVLQGVYHSILRSILNCFLIIGFFQVCTVFTFSLNGSCCNEFFLVHYTTQTISPCSVIIGMEWCGYIYKKGWTNTLNKIYCLDKFTALSTNWTTMSNIVANQQCQWLFGRTIFKQFWFNFRI